MVSWLLHRLRQAMLAWLHVLLWLLQTERTVYLFCHFFWQHLLYSVLHQRQTQQPVTSHTLFGIDPCQRKCLLSRSHYLLLCVIFASAIYQIVRRLTQAFATVTGSTRWWFGLYYSQQSQVHKYLAELQEMALVCCLRATTQPFLWKEKPQKTLQL